MTESVYSYWQFLFRLFLGYYFAVATADSSSDDFVVAGYLPEYRFYININATAAFLTDLILYSLEPNESGLVAGSCCLELSHFQRAREARAQKLETTGRHLNLWVSVGGDQRSKAFKELAANPEKGQKFIKNLKDFCLKEELNGVDFNWVVPQSYKEHEAYMEFLKSAAVALHDAGLFVGMATNSLPHPEAAKLLDRIHMMAYQLARDKYHADFSEVTHFAGQFLQHYPPSKLVLGIPAYAQHFPSGQTDQSFGQIMDSIVMIEDDPAEAVDEMESFNRFRFDSPGAVRRKVDYAFSKNMKGVYIWELGQDKQLQDVAPGGMLVEAAASQAKSKESAKGIDSGEL